MACSGSGQRCRAVSDVLRCQENTRTKVNDHGSSTVLNQAAVALTPGAIKTPAFSYSLSLKATHAFPLIPTVSTISGTIDTGFTSPFPFVREARDGQAEMVVAAVGFQVEIERNNKL